MAALSWSRAGKQAAAVKTAAAAAGRPAPPTDGRPLTGSDGVGWARVDLRIGLLASVAEIRILLSALIRSRTYEFPLIPYLLGLEYNTAAGLPPTVARRRGVRLPLVCVVMVTSFLGTRQWRARAQLADEQFARAIHLSELLGEAERRAYATAATERTTGGHGRLAASGASAGVEVRGALVINCVFPAVATSSPAVATAGPLKKRRRLGAAPPKLTTESRRAKQPQGGEHENVFMAGQVIP
jgi:hypothetical protein